MSDVAKNRSRQDEAAESVEVIAAALLSWFDSDRDGPLEPLEAKVIANDIWVALQNKARERSQ